MTPELPAHRSSNLGTWKGKVARTLGIFPTSVSSASFQGCRAGAWQKKNEAPFHVTRNSSTWAGLPRFWTEVQQHSPLKLRITGGTSQRPSGFLHPPQIAPRQLLSYRYSGTIYIMSSRLVGGLLLRPYVHPIARTAAVPFRANASNTSKPPAPQPTAQNNPSRSGATTESEPAIEDLFNSSSLPEFPKGASSSDELSAGFSAHRFGSNFSFGQRSRESLSRSGLSRSQIEQADSFGMDLARSVAKEEPEVYPRLNASTGRSIVLNDRGRDLVRGLSMLSSLVARNNIRRDFNQQRFHERPGLKRKRLKSERWRRNFKEGFSQAVGRVQELTRKGW